MAVGYPHEGTNGFFWFAFTAVPGATPLVPSAGPFYLGMCDFPRLSDDAGTYPADTIGSWCTPHIL